MPDRHEYRFHIGVFTPDTLSMSRLSEYLSDLAALLGNTQAVHFLRVEEAESSNLAYVVDEPAVPVVQKRLKLVKEKSPNAPQDAVNAFNDINSKLVEDGTDAEIIDTDGAHDPLVGNLLHFPGSKAQTSGQLAQMFGPIFENGFIDGQVVRVGGFDKTIPVHIRSGGVPQYCTADEDMARRLGPYILGRPIRVFGNGKWYRDEREHWKRKLFTITDFKDLAPMSLVDAFAHLRAIPGPLQEIVDPLAQLHKIRYGPEDSEQQ